MATRFELVDIYGGYVNKADITNIAPNFLVKGSQNVISTDGNLIATRKGYTVDGPSAVDTGEELRGGIQSAHDWETFVGEQRHMRSYADKLQFRYVDLNGNVNWYDLMTDLPSSKFDYARDEWWDIRQLVATKLFVNGDNNIHEWNGAVSTVASTTANTITVQGIVETLNTISFQDVDYTASTISFADNNPDQILDSANGFLTGGFIPGATIVVTGSASNDGAYIINTVTAGAITLEPTVQLTPEAAGASINIQSNDTITDSGAGFVTAGFQPGQSITVSGSTSNDGTYTIYSVTAGVIQLATTDGLVDEAAGASVTLSTLGTWAEQGFFISGVANASILIDEIDVLDGETIDITVNGTTYTFTEGVDFLASNLSVTSSLFTFNDGSPRDFAEETTQNFIGDGWDPGVQIQVSGSISNDGIYDLRAVTGTQLQISSGQNFVPESNQYTSNTVAFVASVPGYQLIVDTSANFVAEGYVAGGTVTVSGSANGNDSTYIIADVTPQILFLDLNTPLNADEPVGATVTLQQDPQLVTISTLFTTATVAESLSDAIDAAIPGVEVEFSNNQIFLNVEESTTVINNVEFSGDDGVTIDPSKFPPEPQVIINGVTYTYTGGETSGVLTGVTPSPAGITAGDLVYQAVRTFDNSIITALPNTNSNDLIEILDNQVYIGSNDNRFIYVSKTNNFCDFGFSFPRIVGEGARLTLGGKTKAMIPQEGSMYISAGRDNWYRTRLTLSADIISQTLSIEQLKTNPGEGAIAQSLVEKIKNSVVYISREPALNTLGRLEEIETPQTKNFSDPIKIDFNNLDFSELGDIKYHKFNIYISIPQDDRVYIYNIEKGYWEAPQILPVSKFAIIDGDLYGHSSRTPETYKLFDGYNDAGAPIDVRAVFAFRSFGSRTALKRFNEWYTEGYMSRNTIIFTKINYGLYGCEQVLNGVIKGTDDGIFCSVPSDGGLGKTPLGKCGLGNGCREIDEDDLDKFRIIQTPVNTDFHEVNITFSSNDVDNRWSLLATGPAVGKTFSDNVSIKREMGA